MEGNAMTSGGTMSRPVHFHRSGTRNALIVNSPRLELLVIKAPRQMKKNGDHKVKKRRLTAMNPTCFKNQMMSVAALHSSAPPCLGGPHVFPITAGRVNHGALIAPFFSGLHPVRPNLFTSARENLVRRDRVAAKGHISVPF